MYVAPVIAMYFKTICCFEYAVDKYDAFLGTWGKQQGTYPWGKQHATRSFLNTKINFLEHLIVI